MRRLVIFQIFEVIRIYISVHKIHFGSSKYFTTNGSVSTPIAFPMDKSLDISVFSFRLFSAVQFYILLKRAFLHKININQILPILPNFSISKFSNKIKFSKITGLFHWQGSGSFWKTNWHIEAIKFFSEKNENYEKIMQYDEDNILCYNRYCMNSEKFRIFKPKLSFVRVKSEKW